MITSPVTIFGGFICSDIFSLLLPVLSSIAFIVPAIVILSSPLMLSARFRMRLLKQQNLGSLAIVFGIVPPIAIFISYYIILYVNMGYGGAQQCAQRAISPIISGPTWDRSLDKEKLLVVLILAIIYYTILMGSYLFSKWAEDSSDK